MDPTDLHALLEAAISTFYPKMKTHSDATDLKAWRKQIERGIKRQLREQLSQYVQSFVQEKDFQFQDWVNSITISANRAGLLLCNDLSLAVKLAEQYGRMEQESPEQLELFKTDLIRFSTSDDFLNLRKKIGLSIV